MNCGAIDCDEIGITPEQYLRKAIRLGADGCPALSLSAVAGDGDCTPFFECGLDGGPLPNMTWKQLFFALTGFNQNGCPSLNVVVTGANCRLQDLDFGEIHCNNQALIVLDPFGITYTAYNYTWEYSTNAGASWVTFGASTNYQAIDSLPGFGTPGLYIFRVHVRCNAADTYFRTLYFGSANDFPFKRFLQVEVNGVVRILKQTNQGVNYFCETDTLRFINPNTNFDASVDGPGANDWASNDQTFTPGTLPSGNYQATFTDLSGNACNGTKSFDIEIMAKPVITGDADLCFGETSDLDAGPGYDTYTWYKNGVAVPGGTSQVLTVSTSGAYYVKVTKVNTPGCNLQADTVTVTVAPPMPAVVFSVNPPDPCIQQSGNTFTMVVGTFFTLACQDYGVGASYDWGFGPGPDNFTFVNGLGVFPLVVTLNGCTVNADATVNVVENNTDYNVEQVSGSPCEFNLNLTDTDLIQANVSGSVYGNVSGLLGTFSNTLVWNFVLDPLDTSWSAIMDTQVGSNGCGKALLIIDHPACT